MRFATECMRLQPGLKFWVCDQVETNKILDKIEDQIRDTQWGGPQNLKPGEVKILSFNKPSWWNQCGAYFAYVIGIGKNGKWHVREQYKELISISTVGKFPYYE